MTDIEIVERKSKPMIKMSIIIPFRFKISLSHDGNYAIAIVISEEIVKKSDKSSRKIT